MSLNGARMRYVDDNGEEILVPAKGRTFQIGSYFSCDVLLEPQAERLICEITCDAFGRVTLLNQSNKDTAIHLNDKLIHGQRSHPLLHGNRITILDRVYTWEFHKMSDSEDAPSTPECLPPAEQAPNSCPSLKSHRPQIDKRLTVHNFHYSINSDEEGNTSIESRDQSESHLAEQESLNCSTPPSTEMSSSCETPKVDLVEATQNKENTATPAASHQQLLQLCALSDVVITSYSPRETGVKVEKSFTCVLKPTKSGKQAAAASTPKSVYSTPKGGVLSELNDDSCSRDLVDFCTPSTSRKTKRQSSMYLIDLTTPSKLRPSFKPTPISVDSTDESSDGSPIVIDITNSATPATPGPRSHLAKTPRRPADAAAAATPTRTPQSLMKRALLTSTKKNQIAANQINKTPVATPSRTPRPRNLPRMPFLTLPTPEQKEARHAAFEKKRQSLHLGTPRDNKASQVRKSMAAAKRSPSVDMRIKLKAKARRTLNSPKSSSPKSGSPKPASPTMKTICNVVSHPKCSTPEKVDDSPNDDLSRTFTVMNESGDPAEEGSILGIMSALVTGEMDSSITLNMLEPTPQPTEISENPFVDNPGTELQSAVEKVKSPSKDDDENRTQSFVESCQEPPDNFVPKESTENCSIEKADNIIEDSICEEVHANIPKQLEDDDDKLSKVTDNCEKESPDIKCSDAFAEEENKDQASRVETPMIRRSLRRLSVDQKAGVATTPRRGSSQAETKTEEGSKKGTRRASCSALAETTQEVSGTPRRKRRLSEQMCTPTRQSKRLNKSTLQVDDSIGDMGVIVEEDDDQKSSIVEDENYGKELLPCEEPDNVDYHGLRDLLKTPKNCSTPRFKGLREMMRTPKVPASPIFGNIEELLDNSFEGSSTPNQTGRSITVARVAVDNSKALEGVLKTPSARNIMVPNEPASAVLKSRGDPLATTTEYDLEMTNTTLHLDQIFDDVPSSTSAVANNDTEAEINVTTVSTVSLGLDPLKESSVSSEAPLSVCKLKNEPCITSTTYKSAMQADLELSTTVTEEGGEASRPPSSGGLSEMSGLQLLDQTSDSIFSEPLIVSGVVDSSNVTVDETRAMGQTTFKPLEVNDVDTDSNVGLTEPLVVSDDDDDDEAEVVEDSRVTPKKSTAPQEVSMAYKLEESTASKDATLNQSNSKQAAGKTINRENDSLIEEVSLIEINESVGDEQASIIELDSSSDTEAEPAKDESEAVELTIVDCETSALDSTQEEEVSTSEDKKPVESVDKEAEIVIEIPASDPPVSEEVLEKTDVARTYEEKGNDASAAEEPETLPTDATPNSSIIVDEKLSTNGDPKPTNSESTITEEHSTCETAENQSISHKLTTNKLAEEKAIGVDGPLDSTADNDIVLEEKISTNIDQNPTNFEEDQSVINPIASTEEKITENDGIENDISAVVDADILSFDLTADNSVVEEEFLTKVDQKPIDSDLIITTNDLDTANPAKEDASLINASPSEEQDNTKDTAGAVDSDISPLDSTADSLAIQTNPQAEPLTNDDQKPTNSKSSTTNEDLPGKTAESAIDILPSEESAVDAELSNATTNKMAVESHGQDAEHNKIVRISTATQPEADEVSILKEPKSDAEPLTSEENLVKAAANDDTAEKPEKQIIEELPVATTDGVASETSQPYIHEVEGVSPTDESAPEASASPCPSSDNIEVEETSAVEGKGSIDPVQEVHKNSSIKLQNIKEDEAETGIMEDINPCAEQRANGDESKMIATEGSSKQNATADEKCALQDVDPAEDFNAAEITACEPQESDVAAIRSNLACTEKNEDEVNVNQTKDDSTALETTQNESFAQEPVSPKVEENSLNTSSIIMESFTEQPKPDSTEQNQLHSPKNATIQNKSEDEDNQLDKSSLAGDVAEEDCFVKETPKTKSFVNDPEVVAFSEEMTAQKEEFNPIEESLDRLKKSNEVEDTSIDTSKDIETTKKSLKEQTCHIIPSATAEDDDYVAEQSGEFTTKEKCHDESISDILESSAKLEENLSALQDKSVSENPEISITEEAPNKSIAHDGAQEAAATEEPSIAMLNEDATVISNTPAKTVCDHESSRDSESAKDEQQKDESTSTDANSEGKSRDRTVAEEAVQEIPLASKVAAGGSDVESDHISIEEKAKEAVKNPSLTEDEVMSEELAEGTSDDHHINAKSLNQDTIQTAEVKEVSDVIELSDDDESNLVEDHKPDPVPASEEDAAVPIEETLGTEDPRESKVEDVPDEATPILKVSKTVNEISDVIELSDDSESNPSEDHKPGPVPASEDDAAEETLPTDDSKKANIKNVPEEVTPIAENLNTLNASLSIIETIANQEPKDGQVEDVSDELQNGASAAATLTNQEEQAETPQASEKLAETTSIRESVANVEDEKSQHKSNVEGSADEESPSKEKDEPSGGVANPVELDVEASKEKVFNPDNIPTDKLATRLISSSEPETSEKFKEPSPEPSQSIKHSTMEAVQSPCKPPIRHEDDSSAKEELKPVKRATRKASASVETTPAEEALEKPSRRTRKPFAEVEELKSNDVHEKPKRRVIRKASAEVEPLAQIPDKKENNEEDVLNVISEEAHSSRANEDNEPQKEAVSNQKLEEDVLEKPKRRARKPSAEVKTSDATEKPKRRARKPSAEVPEAPMVPIEKQKEIEGELKEEEQAHSSKINQQQELQEEAGSSQKKEEIERREEHIRNKEEIPEEELNEENVLQEKEEGDKEPTKEMIKSSLERPKRRGRKASAEETETATSKKPKIDDILEVIEETGTQMEQEQETQKPELPKRRGRKASAQEDANNVAKLPTSDEKPEEAHTEGRSRRRGRRPSIDVLEGTAASQPKSENGDAEKPLATPSEDQPSNLTEPKGPQRRTRKSLEFASAEVLESATETEHIERPKRRGRKPSVDIENVVQDVPDKPRRRGRTPAEPEEQQPSGEAKEEEPDKKSRRTARKPSAQTVEVEQLKDIEEVAEAESETATATATPLPEEEEPKTRRRGRKLQLENVEKTPKHTAEVGHSRLRGRRATEDEAAKFEVEGEQQNIEEEAEKKPNRRVRKASANVDEVTAVAKKTNTRRGRREDTHDDGGDGQETEIDLQQVPTESVPAVVIMSSQIGDGAAGSEDDLTPRRREGRNMPRKNYDETSDEDKQRSVRRPRKPAPSKVLAFKAPEEDSTPLPKPQPVEEVETPVDTEPTAEPTSTQRREGRNVPRKNYTEVPDDDKPSTSRNRRVRNLTAKALELIVDSSPRPNTPKGRKAKAAAKDEVPPAKRASLEAVPSTQAESAAAADEEPAPVVVKGRAARRKADDDLPEPGLAAPPPSKRGGRGQHEDAEEQPEANPGPRRARATARKAKVESELNEAAVPTKKARRGGSRAKTPVMPPEDKSVTEPEAHSAPIRKGRGGTRAKTPVVAVAPEDPSSKPADEPPAKKPTARSRARGGGTKAVAAAPEPEQPAQDSDVEPVPSTSTARGGGRAKKVHFEPTETTATAASAQDAPKRATRSRRK